jgi:hypothetical protein
VGTAAASILKLLKIQIRFLIRSLLRAAVLSANFGLGTARAKSASQLASFAQWRKVMTAMPATVSSSEKDSRRAPTSIEARERLAARAIEDLIAAVNASELEEIRQKLDEHTRILSGLTRPNHNGNLLSKAAFAGFLLVAGFAAGAFLSKTWPVMVAWATQVWA